MPSVAVDHELCVGSGDCARIAPSAFRVDDDLGMSVPLDGAADTASDVLVRAAGQCPTNAIRVIDDDGAVLYESA
ncbi:MAG: ferredoxin [Chloroflexota bacterium]